MSDDPKNTPYGRLVAALKDKGGMKKRCGFVWSVYEFWHAHSYSSHTWLEWEDLRIGLLRNAEIAWGRDSKEYKHFEAEIPDINAGVRRWEWEMKRGSSRF